MTKVTLDIFSGLPNPTWELSEQETQELMSRLEALPRTEKIVEPPTLGYRGIVVEGGSDRLDGPLRIYRGTIAAPDGARSDPDRSLETWLLETADPPLDEDIRTLLQE
jgi:hypothetical protein